MASEIDRLLSVYSEPVGGWPKDESRPRPFSSMDSEDYTTDSILSAYSRPHQGPIATSLGIDPTLKRDKILPFADRSWTPATPQFLVDIINAADRVGTSPVASLYARTDENRESAADTASAVVGPMAAMGFARAAFAKPGGTELGIFGGRGARTADHAALAKAEEMAAAGLPREQIWNDTGWFKGADGKWRFEIDDSKSVFTPDTPANRVGESFSHDPLYAAYPIFEKMPFKRDKQTDFRGQRVANGYFSPETGIGIHDELGRTGGRSTMLHELQHAVQEKEDFAKGYNPSEAAKDIAQAKYDAEQLRAKTERMQNAHGDEARAIMRKAASGDAEAAKFVDEATRIWSERLGAHSDDNPFGLHPDQMVAAELGERDAIFRRAITQYGTAFKTSRMDPHDMYRAHAGEVEARAVQARRDLTPGERGPQMSADKLPMDEASRLARAREMGFDTDKTWFHGTKRKFDEFDNDETAFGMGHWFADTKHYADWMATKHGTTIPAYTNVRNPYIFDIMKEAERIRHEVGLDLPEPASSREAMQIIAGHMPWDAVARDIAMVAKSKGHDAVLFKNFEDRPDGWAAGNREALLVFDPKNIRSVDARFEPSKRDSANILAAHAVSPIPISTHDDPTVEDILKLYSKD